jgi:hypothetical protein
MARGRDEFSCAALDIWQSRVAHRALTTLVLQTEPSFV